MVDYYSRVLGLGDDDAGGSMTCANELLIQVRWKLFPILEAIFYELKKGLEIRVLSNNKLRRIHQHHPR